MLLISFPETTIEESDTEESEAGELNGDKKSQIPRQSKRRKHRCEEMGLDE